MLFFCLFFTVKKDKNLQKNDNSFCWLKGVHLYLHQIVFVNLSAFVLAGSHLVLSNTKAESII